MSRLLVSLTSPFARKARIAITELQLPIPLSVVDPWTDASGLRNINPLSKVPTLDLGNGTVLFDSRVIVEYLDSISTTRKLLPPSGEQKFRALRLQALADDACAAALRLLAAKRGPTLDGTQKNKERLLTAVYSSLDQLEREEFDVENWGLAELCAVQLPAYYSFRFPEDDWRKSRPKLTKFVEEMEKKESFQKNPLRE